MIIAPGMPFIPKYNKPIIISMDVAEFSKHLIQEASEMAPVFAANP